MAKTVSIELIRSAGTVNKVKNACTMGGVQPGEEIVSYSGDPVPMKTFMEWSYEEYCNAAPDLLDPAWNELKNYRSTAVKIGNEYRVTEYAIVAAFYDENDEWVMDILIASADWEA